VNKEKVYLAGGMKSAWQDEIKNRFKNKFIFYNPKDHQLVDSTLFNTWDLHYVKKSDIIFAYLEKGNPSGFGLTLEIGYAAALKKTIILVDEKSTTDESFANRFRIVRESVKNIFEDLESGLNFLERFSLYT